MIDRIDLIARSNRNIVSCWDRNNLYILIYFSITFCHQTCDSINADTNNTQHEFDNNLCSNSKAPVHANKNSIIYQFFFGGTISLILLLYAVVYHCKYFHDSGARYRSDRLQVGIKAISCALLLPLVRYSRWK